MAAQGVLVETDILTEFLTARRGEVSLLRRLLAEVPCYTTYVQAAELYSCAVDDNDLRTIEPALFGVRVLGASARYAQTTGQLLRGLSVTSGSLPAWRETLTATIAIEARLPVVTHNFLQNYGQIPAVAIIEAGVVRQLLRRGALREHIAELCANRATRTP